MSFETIALIGFGEVGKALKADMVASGKTVRAYDIAVEADGFDSAAEAVKGAGLIISAVTAARTVDAAKSVIGGIEKGSYYLDLNSAAPATKQQAALIIERAGGRFVEASVMSPIFPKRIASPILLGGPHARMFEADIQALGFTGAKLCSEQLGKASATKLCRSVMIKGLEALISESLLSARFYGVEAEVLASLNNLFPHPDWSGYAQYMISRTLEHGARRSEEMFEAAKTVEGAGIHPLMATATAHRQAEMPAYASALSETDLLRMLDAIRAQINTTEDA
ncbi:MAG: DUF1932 domain-containing protein [Asticcacaulis sp.]